MNVSDFMTTEVVTVEIPGNRDDVLKILKRTGISGVPVLKEGKLVGIITRKDLLRKADETQLGLLMTRNPATVSPDTPVEEAARILIEKNVRSFRWSKGRNSSDCSRSPILSMPSPSCG